MTTAARAAAVVLAVAVAVAVAVLPRVAASGGQGPEASTASSTVTADRVEIVAIEYVPDTADPSLVSAVDLRITGTLHPTTQVDVRLSPSSSWYRCSVVSTPSGDVAGTDLRCRPDGEMTSSSQPRDVTVVLSRV